MGSKKMKTERCFTCGKDVPIRFMSSHIDKFDSNQWIPRRVCSVCGYCMENPISIGWPLCAGFAFWMLGLYLYSNMLPAMILAYFAFFGIVLVEVLLHQMDVRWLKAEIKAFEEKEKEEKAVYETYDYEYGGYPRR